MTTVQPVLNFDATSHTYSVDGVTFPSITQVIEAAGLVDYSMIPEADLDFYKKRGAALHQACWFDDEGDLKEGSVDILVMSRLQAWRKFRQDLRFDVIVSEERRFDRIYGYAGTPDRLVKLPNGDRAVVELKSGPLQPAVAIQLAAQCNLFEPQGGRLRRFAVHLKADGTYSLKEFYLTKMRQDLGLFLNCLAIFNWKALNL